MGGVGVVRSVPARPIRKTFATLPKRSEASGLTSKGGGMECG